MLEVRLIGRFDIQCDGKPVILSSRAAQCLFAYLILTSGTLHRREKLAGMLWPDGTEQKARTYLRNEIWRIRNALSKTSDIEYFLADNLTIGFNPSSEYWLDIGGLKIRSDTASAEELIKALSNYQGELLPGFYEDWVVLEREQLQMLFAQKIARLLEMLEKERCWNDVLEWAELWISAGQGPETAYRYLMIAYEALGDKAMVDSTYKRCVETMHQLDLEPSEQTRALAFKRNPKLNIPVPLTSFIGREQELKEVADLVSKFRLITLAGSGGVGKTRLAIQVVADVLELFPDGVWFIDFAPLGDPLLVPQVVVTTLGLIEQPSRLPVMALADFLQGKRVLLILDNCEHLIQACAQITETLLRACPGLHILTTSREMLRSEGELPYRVPSLETPRLNTEAVGDSTAKIESVRLFVERAAFASSDFTLSPQNAIFIAQICQRLDGIPLAIELAAARASVLTVEQILKRLDDRFTLLTSGLRTTLPRQQTLRATIDWSYNLLSSPEQLLFERLSVFAGEWSLEAAESICGADGIEPHRTLDLLTELVNKSLILADRKQGQETRYRMLETIRQYARTKLSSATEVQNMHQRHLAYFVDLAERAEPNLRAFDMLTWLDRLETELDNIRVALAYAQESDVEAQLRLASALLCFWHIRGHKNEGADWLEQGLSIEVIEREEKSLWLERALIRGKALNAAGFIRLMLNESNKGIVLSEESLKIFRELGLAGRKGMAYALWNLSVVVYRRLDLRKRKALIEESLVLFEETGDKFGKAQCVDKLWQCALYEHDFEQAKALSEAHLALRQELGDKDGEALAFFGLGHLALHQGNFEEATTNFEASVARFREVGNRGAMGMALSSLGSVARALGDYRQARIMLEDALTLGENLGDKASIADWVNELGLVALSQGDYRRATQMHERALTLASEVGYPFCVSTALRNLGNVALAQANYQQASKNFEDALTLSIETDDKLEIAFALYGKGRVAQARGHLAPARELYSESILLFRELDEPLDVAQGVAQCLDAFALLAVTQEQLKRAACLFSAAESLYTPLRFELSAKDRDEHDRSIVTARAALGDEAYTAAYEAGKQKSLDEAVTYALTELQ